MRKFILKSLFYFIPFGCVYGSEYLMNIHGYFSGDLGRLGQIPFGKDYIPFLEKNYLPNDWTIDTTFMMPYKKLEVAGTSKILTIGDSFSQQGITGYQNYLAHLFGIKIVNICIERKNYGTSVQRAVALLNSGIIDSSKCSILIIEKVDRNIIGDLDTVDFTRQYQLPKKEINPKKEGTNKMDINWLCSCIRLQFFGYDNPVLEYNLKQACFTANNRFSRKLYCYLDDMNFKKTSKTDIEKAKENLILLNKKFSEKGIKLIFLIAADKYGVYRPFMADNSLPVDTITDGLSKLPGVFVINTKPMLQNMVRNGEKDVYMVNDTHWSYKASEAVARKLAHDIDSLGIMK